MRRRGMLLHTRSRPPCMVADRVDVIHRLWQLLTELSAQLSANKEHCDSLKRQCEQLKVRPIIHTTLSSVSNPSLLEYQTQAIHTGTGFTLRRFNTDITKGKAASSYTTCRQRKMSWLVNFYRLMALQNNSNRNWRDSTLLLYWRIKHYNMRTVSLVCYSKTMKGRWIM